MNLFSTNVTSFQFLISLRHFGFLLLNCGALGATILFPFRGGQATRYWLLVAIAAGMALFAVSFTHLKHQRPHVMNFGARGVSAETTISCTVQELGENVMKLFLFGASLYIVLRGIGLLLLFSRKRVPDAPVMIARFFVGSILCAVILGLGVSAHWLFSPGRGSSSVLTALDCVRNRENARESK